MVRSVLLPLVLALAVLWGAIAACVEIGRALSTWDRRARQYAAVIFWREGMPQVERLRRFTEAARPLLPPGSRVVFSSPDDGPGQQTFRTRWVAYLLPEVDVEPFTDPTAPCPGCYLLAYHPRLRHPRLEPVRRLPGGWLYRVRG
jgi:hypothetical protein